MASGRAKFENRHLWLWLTKYQGVSVQKKQSVEELFVAGAAFKVLLCQLECGSNEMKRGAMESS